jgi:hypothetical protein
MARNRRSGLDYFPLNVTLDEKFRFIEIKFGLEGFAVIIKLLQKIYFNCYYMKLGEDEAVLIADELRMDYTRFVEILDEALKRGMFNKELYESYQILTSRGIQRVFLTATKKRVSKDIEPKFLLVEEVSEEETAISAEEIPISDAESTQSKVKESKEKQSKVNQKNKNNLEHEEDLAGVEDSKKELAATQDKKLTKAQVEDVFKLFWELYPRKRAKGDALKAWQAIKLTQELLDKILASVKKALEVEWAKTDPKFIPYPATWLRAQGWEDEYGSPKANVTQFPKSASRFNNIGSHNWDFNELERLEQEHIQKKLMK